MKSIFLTIMLILGFTITIVRGQDERWKFNTNTCNTPPSISFDMNFLNTPSNNGNDVMLQIHATKGKFFLNPPLGSIRMNTIVTNQLEVPQDSIVTIIMPSGTLFNISSKQPTWYELNENIIKKFYNAAIIGGGRNILIVKSKKIDKEEIKQIICDYWK